MSGICVSVGSSNASRCIEAILKRMARFGQRAKTIEISEELALVKINKLELIKG